MPDVEKIGERWIEGGRIRLFLLESVESFQHFGLRVDTLLLFFLLFIRFAIAVEIALRRRWAEGLGSENGQSHFPTGEIRIRQEIYNTAVTAVPLRPSPRSHHLVPILPFYIRHSFIRLSSPVKMSSPAPPFPISFRIALPVTIRQCYASRPRRSPTISFTRG